MLKYDILWNADPGQLIQKVNDANSNGWKPQGGISAVHLSITAFDSTHISQDIISFYPYQR